MCCRVSACVIAFFELTHCGRILSSDRNPETDVRFAARFARFETLDVGAWQSHRGGLRAARAAGAAMRARVVGGDHPIGPLGTAQVATPAQAELPALRRDVFHRSVPEASSDGIVLHGVRTGGTQAAAFLSSGDGRQGAYRIGDVVVAGVTVQAIASDHVLLRTGGGVRRLALVESTASSAPPRQQRARQQPPAPHLR